MEPLIQYALGPSAVAVVGWVLNKRIGAVDRRVGRTAETVASTAAATEQVREQVQNSHATNLRHDLDAIHTSIRGVQSDLTDVRDDQRVLHRDVRGIHRDVSDLRNGARVQDRRIAWLETHHDPPAEQHAQAG